MNIKRQPFAIALVALFLLACSPKYIQMYNIHNEPVPAGLTQEQVGKGVRMGATVAGWKAHSRGPGRTQATYNIRAHTVTVDIRYSEYNYSIDYETSHQMKIYCTEEDKEAGIGRTLTTGGGACPGVDQPAYIHENYRVWIDQLNRSINAALQEIDT